MNPHCTAPFAADIAGVVLAGGRSARMGTEKAHIRAYGDAEPDMLERTRALLGELLPVVWISCRADNLKTGFDCVVDTQPGHGPFGGVYAALLRAHDEGLRGVLPLSCDLPFMDAATLRRLLAARAAAPGSLMTTFRQAETGYIEALTAVYTVGALPYFEQALHAGVRKLSVVVPAHLRADIVYTREEALPFFNLNYPADLAACQRLLANAGN